MFESIVLLCIKRFKGERTVSGIFNMLTGKRSSQTMQDAKAYQLDHMFGVFPELERRKLDNAIDQMAGREEVVVNEEGFPNLTDKGTDHLQTQRASSSAYFQGMQWHEVLPAFISRLNLLIQASSNKEAGIQSYVAIVDQPGAQAWVKKVFGTFQDKLPRLNQSLYEELVRLLSNHDPVQTELFTHRLTGGGWIGLTVDQLKEKYRLSREDILLGLRHTYYYLFQQAKKDKEAYPVLHLCTRGLQSSHLVTASAGKTYQLIEQGLSLEEIVTVRRLKKSTIQDHIVEAALVTPDFDVSPFLSAEQVEEINQKAMDLNTQRLKHIHQDLGGVYDYFEIRLALAHGRSTAQRERKPSS
ncbi:helix-turn-helix domain-containing protein [Halobacillus litoralis]|uniref:helix-turn-helix domain-containing protein n=1 Tax=Halobacillus litoralis TaxID=45668 RepID=UPI00136B3950|nr:helix-turn-helix domain-containing protein [Halobacillus litoralis]MYL37965.1 hypothetical protein [Halobacillus litoralis]